MIDICVTDYTSRPSQYVGLRYTTAMAGPGLPSPGGSAAAILLLLLSFCASGDALLCYRCEDAHSNEECNVASNLVNCKNVSQQDSARPDTCRTRVVQTDEGVRYYKGCVVGPCTLSINQDVALGLTDCDRSTANWDCEYCCKHDKCNASAATCWRITVTTVTWYMAAIFGLVKLFF